MPKSDWISIGNLLEANGLEEFEVYTILKRGLPLYKHGRHFCCSMAYDSACYKEILLLKIDQKLKDWEVFLDSGVDKHDKEESSRVQLWQSKQSHWFDLDIIKRELDEMRMNLTIRDFGDISLIKSLSDAVNVLKIEKQRLTGEIEEIKASLNDGSSCKYHRRPADDQKLLDEIEQLKLCHCKFDDINKFYLTNKAKNLNYKVLKPQEKHLLALCEELKVGCPKMARIVIDSMPGFLPSTRVAGIQGARHPGMF